MILKRLKDAKTTQKTQKSECVTDRPTDRPTDRHSRVQSRVHATKNSTGDDTHVKLTKHFFTTVTFEQLPVKFIPGESLISGKPAKKTCL